MREQKPALKGTQLDFDQLKKIVIDKVSTKIAIKEQEKKVRMNLSS